ncbi:hypothetical protein ABXN37_19730 [Piscinibacter sakaiensis]|uniref:Uncharacterized protein n=1 Tax=Piscinibacter sakaiensis TaxID=1547922 RepID=A0A0K8P411_PISS1|nr:hypothetical protein [Piscinibacter sakaiensis]GAP37357.1 hypothetical protein ISF6_3212 [Piscinibacter sakaiensis]
MPTRRLPAWAELVLLLLAHAVAFAALAAAIALVLGAIAALT